MRNRAPTREDRAATSTNRGPATRSIVWRGGRTRPVARSTSSTQRSSQPGEGPRPNGGNTYTLGHKLANAQVAHTGGRRQPVKETSLEIQSRHGRPGGQHPQKTAHFTILHGWVNKQSVDSGGCVGLVPYRAGLIWFRDQMRRAGPMVRRAASQVASQWVPMHLEGRSSSVAVTSGPLRTDG